MAGDAGWVVVGVDCAARRSGWAVLTGGPDGVALRMVTVTDAQDLGGMARARRHLKMLRHLLVEHGPVDAVGFEGYASRFKSSIIAGVECQTPLRMHCLDEGVPYYVLQPSQARRWVLGAGGESKGAVADLLERHWGVRVADPDMADATVVALGTAVVLGHVDPVSPNRVDGLTRAERALVGRPRALYAGDIKKVRPGG